MTDKERIERISKLLNELDLDDITSAEFDEMFPKQSINDLKDELWRMYCFAEDVCYTINMGDTAEQEPKIGVWVEIDENPHEVWECSHCGFVIDGSGCVDPYEYRDIYNYCPKCGARMEVENG